MKRIISVALLVFTFMFGLGISAQACGTTVWDLTEGQTNKVGTVTVSNDATNLYITYALTDPGATFGTLHLWVGNDLSLLPETSTGNPIPGQFPYAHDGTGLNAYTFTIPFAAINITDLSAVCGTSLYIVAHADTPGGTSFCGPTPGITGNRWWFYGSYVICCDPVDPPSLACFSETAFAKQALPYGWIFTTDKKSNPENLPSLRLSKNRWGWAINPTLGISTYDIWAGAGLNRTSNGTKVGTLTVNWNGTTATVTANMFTGYYLQEVHIYASDNQPATIAPGQYGYPAFGYEVENLSTYTTDVPLYDYDGDRAVWMIFHAAVSSGACLTQ